MSVDELSADAGEGHLVADVEVRRTADHGLLAGADINRGQPQAVGVGVGIDGDNPADDDIVPFTPDYLYPLGLNPGHGQPSRQLGRGQGNIDIFFKPLERNFHLVT